MLWSIGKRHILRRWRQSTGTFRTWTLTSTSYMPFSYESSQMLWPIGCFKPSTRSCSGTKRIWTWTWTSWNRYFFQWIITTVKTLENVNDYNGNKHQTSIIDVKMTLNWRRMFTEIKYLESCQGTHICYKLQEKTFMFPDVDVKNQVHAVPELWRKRQ